MGPLVVCHRCLGYESRMRTGPNPSSKASPGSMHLFQFRGIDVYLHFSWAIVALIEIQSRRQDYSHIFYNILEYLSLFAIVLMHEFGHSLACRSVGGRADRILLWPFGGVAFVDPPNRPGAHLWSIVAGPLVNVVLLPITILAAASIGRIYPEATADLRHYFKSVAYINAGLLIFNILPVYPLDGGQILRSLLWYVVGPVRSLKAAASIGIVGAIGILGLAAYSGDAWLIMLAILGLSQCWQGLKAARNLGAMSRIPRHAGYACPTCREAPPVGPYWMCACGGRFDTFVTGFACPQCGQRYLETACPFCRSKSLGPEWLPPGSAPMAVVVQPDGGGSRPGGWSNPPGSG